MMIKVLLFAHLQESVGESMLEINSEVESVGTLKEWLAVHYPLPGIRQVMTAVNEAYATDATILHPGDTVAFIPPVSGG